MAPPPRLRRPDETPEPRPAMIPEATISPLLPSARVLAVETPPIPSSPFDRSVELQLGDVLTDPFGPVLEALNRDCRTPFDPDYMEKIDRLAGFRATRRELLSGKLGLWASLLAAVGLASEVNVGVFLESHSDDIIEIAELETRRFRVTDKYVEDVLRSPDIIRHLSKHPSAALWIISGMK